MFRKFNVTPPYRIRMNIVNFLFHDSRILHPLWVRPLLPELVAAVHFVFEFVECQLIKNEPVFVFQVVVDAFAGRKGFEFCYFAG